MILANTKKKDIEKEKAKKKYETKGPLEILLQAYTYIHKRVRHVGADLMTGLSDNARACSRRPLRTLHEVNHFYNSYFFSFFP